MLTPSFDISQDKEFVIVKIRVPYVKISEAEFHINGCEFKFYCKPYFLRLHLPGELVEDGREKAVYDVEGGAIMVHLPKLNCEEHFENLDMITTLLSKKPAKISKDNAAGKPLIEVEGLGDMEGNASESEDDFDWQMEQQLPEDEGMNTPVSLTLPSCAYGFATQYQGVFAKLQEEIPSIIDCSDPDHMTSHERRLARIAHEEISFDPDHYLADLMDNDSIGTLLDFKPSSKEELLKWTNMKQEIAKQDASTCGLRSKCTEASQDIVPFTQTEKEQLKDLPNKEYLLDKATKRCLYLGLIDIVYAFAYNQRTTEGEDNVESAWTVCKLSPTLSWLEVHHGSVHEVIHSCLRRSLCYPLYRHWQLSLAVLQDTRDIFRIGRRKLLQCLLSIRHCLNSFDPYYILNNLYITDYCVWIQKSSTKNVQAMADDLVEVNVTKDSLGWELEELEQAAHMVLEDNVTDTEESSYTSENDSEESSLSICSSSDEDEPKKKPTIVSFKSENDIKAGRDKDPTPVFNGGVHHPGPISFCENGDHQLKHDTMKDSRTTSKCCSMLSVQADTHAELDVTKHSQHVGRASPQSVEVAENIAPESAEKQLEEMTVISPSMGAHQLGVLERLMNLELNDDELPSQDQED